MQLSCGTQTLDLSMPAVMGILNVTPDSFSDGGRYVEPDRAVEHGLAMIEAGAAVIDVGGESTRPGAPPVSEAEELRRVLPVIERLAARVTVPLSVDTSKPSVMRAALAAGASMINDIQALRAPGALAAVAESGAAVCLMHMQGTPQTMQVSPMYQNVVVEVTEFLAGRIAACEASGIDRHRLVVDPGIGFGKRLEHNLALLAAIPQLTALGLPVLIGASRKSMIGILLGAGVGNRPTGNRAADSRLWGDVALATAAVLAGASIIRAHDVAAIHDAVRIAAALRAAKLSL